jgi:hypothetical protein
VFPFGFDIFCEVWDAPSERRRVLHSPMQVLVVSSVPYMMPSGKDITAAGLQGGLTQVVRMVMNCASFYLCEVLRECVKQEMKKEQIEQQYLCTTP